MTVNNSSLAAKLSKDNVISTRGSPSSVISYLSETQEEPKRELAEKLLRFREQSKTELQKSWDEVESLYRKRANYVKIKSQLEKSLKESAEREKMWRSRCLEAEAAVTHKSKQKVLQHRNNTSSFRYNMHLSSSRKLRRIDEAHTAESDEIISQSSEQRQLSYTGMSKRPTASLSNNTSPQKLSNDTEIGQSTQFSLKKKNQFSDLILQLSSRDLIIASLEGVLNELYNHIQTVRLEMECLIEAQHIKEKNLLSSDSIVRKQLLQEKLLKKVELSNNCVKQRERATLDSKNCIEDLANELEHLLKLVKIAEDRGFCFRDSYSTFSSTSVAVPINSPTH